MVDVWAYVGEGAAMDEMGGEVVGSNKLIPPDFEYTSQ